MKVVVLTCSTGQGHNSAAAAISEVFSARGHDCSVVDAMSFGTKNTSKVVSGTYINMAVRTPRAFGGIYKAGKAVSAISHHSPVYFANTFYAKRLYSYILKEHIDAAVCTHLFPLEALTFLRRKGLPLDFFAVCTDYTCIPFWPEIRPDLNFTPHSDLTDEMIACKVPADTIVPTGIPVSRRFCEKTEKHEARRLLGLPDDAVTYLVMTGSMGFGSITDMAAELLKRNGQNTRVIVIAGRNEALLKAVDEKFGSDERVVRVGFTNRIPLYMDASDVLLSKPGGLSSTEAAVKNIPLIHTMPIPGCETKNAEFFSSRNMSITAFSPVSAAEKATDLALNPELMKKMILAQKSIINPNAAEDICINIEKYLKI